MAHEVRSREWEFWWESSTATSSVADGEQLVALLREAVVDGTEGRAMAELASPSGARMAIGLGEMESVATFCESYESPPYYISRGEGQSGDVVVFFYDGHGTEFDRGAVIARTVAIEAMQEFFATGRRPTRITWAEA